MAEIGHWANISFVVNSSVIRSFKDLTIEGSVETEDVTDNSIKYVRNKARKPTEVSVTVQLDARLGNDVRNLASDLVDGATYGREEYFYLAGRKLVPYKMKLVQANVSEVQMASDGTWISCEVKLNMKQSGMPDQYVAPSSTAGGGGSGGYPAAQGSRKVTVTPTRTTTAKTVASALSSAVKDAASSATDYIKKMVSNAKTATASKIALTNTKAGSGGGGKRAMPLN